jgi:hypothetical protein
MLTGSVRLICSLSALFPFLTVARTAVRGMRALVVLSALASLPAAVAVAQAGGATRGQVQGPASDAVAPPRPFSTLVGNGSALLQQPHVSRGVTYARAVRPQADGRRTDWVTACGEFRIPHLDYFGGPVISNVNVIPVFWNTNVNAEIVTEIPGFFQRMESNPGTYSQPMEYSTELKGGTNQVIGQGTAASSGITLNPAVCPATTTGTCTVQDSDILAELTADIKRGVLPQPTTDSSGHVNTVFMLYFPPNVDVTSPAVGLPSCQDSSAQASFCGYHNWGGTESSPLIYSTIMDYYSGNCSKVCGADTPLQDEETVSYHELNEAITDPEAISTFVLPLAWMDSHTGCEVADICAWHQVPVTTNGITDTVQQMWSNWMGDCVSPGQFPAYSANITEQPSAGLPVLLTLTVQDPRQSPPTTLKSYGGTVHFTSSDPLATLPADYSFTANDGGQKQFAVTFNTPGNQTITATDTLNNLITATTAPVVVSPGGSPGFTSPVPEATISGETTFTWTPGNQKVNEWRITMSLIGPGGDEVLDTGAFSGTITSKMLFVQADGVTLYVRLWFEVGSTWNSVDAQYLESGVATAPQIVFPTPLSTLTGANQPFVWTGGAGAAQFEFTLGTTAAGSNNIYDSGLIHSTGTVNVAGIPTVGAKLFARLSYEENGVWSHIDTTYTEASGTPAAVATTTAAGNDGLQFDTAAQQAGLVATVTTANGFAVGGWVTFTVFNTDGTQMGVPVAADVESNGEAITNFPLPAGLPVGTYPVHAVYTPGAGFAASSDNSGSIDINQDMIQVNVTSDPASGNPINCPLDNSGPCSLRDALAAAQEAGTATVGFDINVFTNSNTAAENTIRLSSGTTLTIPANTTIRGLTGFNPERNLVTIDGGNGTFGNFPIFTVPSGVKGASLNNLTLANGSNPSGNGGAVDNSGALSVFNCTFANNSAAAGGAIANGDGGSSASLTIQGSTFTGNTAGTGGGALMNFAAGTLAVETSTFSGNSATTSGASGKGLGGGIRNQNVLSLSNVTLTGNAANGGHGGGLYNENLPKTNIGNSIVDGNFDGTLASHGAADDIADSAGGSAFGNGQGNKGGNIVGTYNASSINAAPPNLAPLGNYGGVTQAFLPLPGSPAICAGLQANLVATFDQRGNAPTNTSYSGVNSQPCVDAGSVETLYAMGFSTQPAASETSGTAFPAAVALTEDSNVFAAVSQSIGLTVIPSSAGVTLAGTPASTDTTTGIATYSLTANSASAQSNLQLQANLTLNGGVFINANSSAFSLSGNPLAPAVTGINPAAGANTGGTTVTISGSNFTGATAVDFGGIAAKSFLVNSSTSISATSPPGSGTVDITVTTATGTSSKTPADQFTYQVPNLPTVTFLDPPIGVNTGGTAVTILGTNFTGATAVTFGGSAAESFVVNSSTSISATSPPGSGTVDVTVTAPGGTSAKTGLDQFLYVVPQATQIQTSVTPSSTFAYGQQPSISITLVPAVNALTAADFTATLDNTTALTLTAGTNPGSFNVLLPTAPLAAGGHTIAVAYSGNVPYFLPSNALIILIVNPPSFVVTTANDDNSGGANCISGGSTCSLRDALVGAAEAGGGAITFSSSVFTAPTTINLTHGALILPTLTTVTGPTQGTGGGRQLLVSISGNNQSSVLVENAGAQGAMVFNLNIENGGKASSPSGVPGFVVTAGGSGYTNPTVTISDPTGTGATATALVSNGAISAILVTNSGSGYTDPSVTITDPTGTGAQVNAAYGSGVVNYGSLSLLDTVVTSNSDNGSGGGIINAGTLQANQSTIAGNSATGGAGVFNAANSSLTLSQSTISGNSASVQGGGILNFGTMSVESSTIANNSFSVAAGQGGGIYSTGPITIFGSTISANNAGSAGQDGGVFSSGKITVSNSIIAGNSAATFADLFAKTLVDNGGNLVGTGSSGTSAIQAMLTPLGNHGGLNQTMVPIVGSPAICNGLLGNIPKGDAMDQRGEPNTNGNYAGYSTAAPCTDSGAVQSHYLLNWITEPPNEPAGVTMSPAPQVELTEADVVFADGADSFSVTLSLSTGTGNITGGSASISAATGIATFSNLSIDTPGNGDIFTATMAVNPNSSPAASLKQNSEFFNITANASAGKLAFAVAPAASLTAGGNAGSGIQVAEEDSSGTIDKLATDTIQLSVTGPKGYAQTYNSKASAGVATFDLSSDPLTAAGQYSYSASVSGQPSIPPAGVTETVTAAAAANVIAVSGTGQTAVIGSVFAQPLKAMVNDQFSNPVSGATVTFGTPASGASASLTAPSATAADGTTSVTATANGVAGATPYTVTAQVAGAANAADFQLTNQQHSTSLTVSPSATSLLYGQPASAEAVITPAAILSSSPTGTVTFFDGASPLSPPSAVTSGAATFTIGVPAVGSHTFSAQYNGDTNFSQSALTAAAAPLVISKASSTLSGPASPVSVTFGAGGSFSISVAGQFSGAGIATPSGSISYVIGSGSAQTAAITSGAATISIPANEAVGTYSVTVNYAGDANYKPAAQINAGFAVTKATATVKLNNLAQTYTGSPLSVTATTVPAGLTVNLTYNGSSAPPVAAGSYSVVATVADPNYQGSATGTLVIGQATPAITWVTPAPIVYGTALSAAQLNASANVPGAFAYSPVAGTVPGAGTQILKTVFTPTDSADYATVARSVQLTVNAAPLTVTVNNQTMIYGGPLPTLTGTITGVIAGDGITATFATTATSSSPVGVYPITATLNDPNSRLANYSVTNKPGTLTIGQATPSISWSAPAAVTYGTPLGSAQLDATSSVKGTFAYSPAAGTILGAGAHSLGTTFTPADPVDYVTASDSVMLTVNQATPAIGVASSQNPLSLGQSVTFTATLSTPAGTTPTGSVTFWDGTTQLGSGALNGGVATFATSALTLGAHSITAVYSGDANFVSVTSTALAEVVVQFSIDPASGSSSSETGIPGGFVTYQLTVTPPSTSPVNLVVTGLPAGFTGSFTPSTVPAGAGPTNVTLTINIPAEVASAPAQAPARPGSSNPLPTALALLLLPLLGLGKPARRLRRLLLVAVLFVAGLAVTAGLSGCSHAANFGGNNNHPPSPGTYTLTATASAGTQSQSTTLTLIVQ